MALSTLLDVHVGSPSEVSVLLADDKSLRDLNRRFRGIDEATDVLSFPGRDFEGAPLGDIAISLDYAGRQSRIRGVRPEEEAAMLAIHGGLHLCGFEDETEAGRRQMIDLMNVVALKVGLPPDTEWQSLPHGDGL